ncbi:MAG TPA: hypothetical protein VGJ28_15020, partial [Micromonosporaceae bacterium]
MFAASPSVNDSSLLPASVPAVTVTAANAHTVVATLTRKAHDPSAAGLVALVQLAGLADMPIMDASEGGKLVIAPRSRHELFPIEAGQLIDIHEWLASGRTISLAELTGIITSGLTNTDVSTDTHSITAIGSDLRAAADGSSLGARVWADAILTSNPAADALTSSTPPADVQIDGLQATFLLLQLEHALVEQIPHPASPAPADARDGAGLSLAALSGGCDLEDEIKQELFDLGVSAVGTVKDGVHEAWLDWLMEEVGIDASNLSTRTLATILAGINMVMPLLEVIFASISFNATISPAAPHLDRTKKTTESGGYAKLTAAFKFLPKDNSHFTHCIALFLSGMLTDVAAPSSGQMRGMGVTWDLLEGGAQGNGDLGFVDLCGTACGKDQQVIGGYTDENGTASETVEGLKQRKDMSDARVSVQRTALVDVAVNPKDLANRTANAIKTIAEAASAAAGSAMVPPAGIARALARAFYEFGGLNVSKSVTVKDWVDGFDLSYDLQVSPAFLPGTSSTGYWELASKVHLTFDQQNGFYEGSAPLTYLKSTATQTVRQQATTLDCGCHYPAEGTQCGAGFGGCLIPGCYFLGTSRTVGTVPGTLAVVMTLNHDANGDVTTIKDISYNIEGIKEKTLNQGQQLTGPCTLRDGTKSQPDETDTTTNAESGWRFALEFGAVPGMTEFHHSPTYGFVRTRFDQGTTDSPVLGHAMTVFR